MKHNIIGLTLVCAVSFLNAMEQNTFNKESYAKAHLGFADQAIRAMEQSDDDGVNAVQATIELQGILLQEALKCKRSKAVSTLLEHDKDLLKEMPFPLISQAADSSEEIKSALGKTYLRLGDIEMMKYLLFSDLPKAKHATSEISNPEEH